MHTIKDSQSHEALVIIDNVSVRSSSHKILDSTSLRVYQGDRIAIMGPSGSGKTTLLRLACGLLGSLKQRSLVVSGSCECRGSAAFMPQDSRDLVLPWLPLSSQLSDRRLVELDLLNRRSQFPRELSGGELRRAALGIIADLKRDVYFLDEPLTGLDVDLRKKAIEVLKRSLSAKSALVFVTHYREEATELGSKGVLVNGATIVEYDSISEMLRSLDGVLGYDE